MNTTRTSRVDQIIALIDACLADIEGSPTPTTAPSMSTITRRPGPSRRPLPSRYQPKGPASMYSPLTEMLASAHRDELCRQASHHGVARRGRQSRRQAAGSSRYRLLNFRLPERHAELCPVPAPAA
jgi:hypothetical protein